MERKVVEAAISELDALLTADSRVERDYQDWFENHPVAMMALGYKRAVPHPTIPLSEGRSGIPDFFVLAPDDGWEVFELKTPQTRVLAARDRRATFYSEFARYVAQCQEYSEAFDDEAIRTAFSVANGFAVGKRPSTIIVAGRSGGLDRERTRAIASRYHPTIRHFTFDDVREQLDSYRTFNFGQYDSARGLALFFVLQLRRPPRSYVNNHIFDVGVTPNRDHVSVFMNPAGALRLVVHDSSGRRYDAHSSEVFSNEDFERVHYLYFDVGVGDGFGFLTIEMDGRYYADLRLQDFPFVFSREYALGTNANGTGESWMDAMVIQVYDQPLGFRDKGLLRNYGSSRAQEEFAEPGSRRVCFNGNQFLATKGHPSQHK